MDRPTSGDWKADMFKDVSLFADSDLVWNVIEHDSYESFLDEARAFWEVSRQQVGTRQQVGKLIEDPKDKLMVQI